CERVGAWGPSRGPRTRTTPEKRHGSAGALRTLGAWGHLGAPISKGLPVGGEDVEAARRGGAAAAAEDQALAVAGEHREGREAVGPGDALEAGAIDVHQVEREGAAGGIVQVGREDDLPAIGMHERREVRAGQPRDPGERGAVGLHHVDVEATGPHETLLEQGPVVVELLARL